MGELCIAGKKKKKISKADKELSLVTEKWRKAIQEAIHCLPENKIEISVTSNFSLILPEKKCPLTLVNIDSVKYGYENVDAFYLGYWPDPARPNGTSQHWIFCEGEKYPYYFGKASELSLEEFFEEFGIKPVILKSSGEKIRRAFVSIVTGR
jgi:hypothetical protein